MPAPIGAGIAAAARYIAKHGIRKATAKYGKAAVDKAKKVDRGKVNVVSRSAGAALREASAQRTQQKPPATKTISKRKQKIAASKEAIKNAKGPVAKRRAQYDALKSNTKLPGPVAKREQQNADMKDKMAAKKKATKARSAAAKKAVANAKGPVAKRRAQYDALKSNTKMSKRFASRDRQNAEMKRKMAAKKKRK